MRRRGTTNLDDIRRAMRLGMGPCQGGFCIYRATGILHAVERLDGEEAAASLTDFLQERWKGVWPILYGDQLRQARLDDWIFQGLLDVEHLPRRDGSKPSVRVSHHDVVVVGTGLAGLTAAVRLAESGARVLVLAKGVGATHLSAGTIDVLGYAPERVERPREALARSSSAGPSIPTRSSAPTGSPPRSTGSRTGSRTARSRPTPTPAGSTRTCCCRPRSACRARRRSCRRRWPAATCAATRRSAWSASAAEGLPPGAAADNLRRGRRSRRARSSSTSCPRAAPTSTRSGSRARFDDATFRGEVVAQLVAAAQGRRARRVPRRARASPIRTGSGASWSTGSAARCSRVPTLPPSVPGMRVFAILREALRRAGGRVLLNTVVGRRARGRTRARAARAGRAARGAPRRRLGRARDRRLRVAAGSSSTRTGRRARSRSACRSAACPSPARSASAPGYFDGPPDGARRRGGRRRAAARRRGGERLFENVLVAGRDARRRRAVAGEVRRRDQPLDRPPRGRARARGVGPAGSAAGAAEG